jgi:hypothetical protein
VSVEFEQVVQDVAADPGERFPGPANQIEALAYAISDRSMTRSRFSMTPWGVMMSDGV